MKVKGSLYWIYSFISGCKGKMLVAILLAVIGYCVEWHPILRSQEFCRD